MKKLYPLLALVFLFLSAAAQAQESSLDSIYARERALNNVSSALYKFEHERDSLASGDKQLGNDVREYAVKIRNWIKGYDALISKADGEADLNRLETLIRVELSRLAHDRATIARDAARIESRLNSVTLRSDADILVSEELVNERASLIAAQKKFKQNIQNYRDAMRTLEAKISAVSASFTTDLFFASYLGKAIRAGISENEPKVKAFRSFIEAEMIGRPLVSDVKAAANDFSVMMVTMRGQTLQKMLVELKVLSLANQNAIRISSLVEAEKTRLIAEIQALETKAQADYDSTVKPYSSAALASAMHKALLRKHNQVCQTPGKSCELYNELKLVKSADVAKYNVKSIVYLEDLWADLESRVRK